ncbi:unnamed protein product (macronuclear) [Paramecium tetraurelia]|uniref:Cyclic nucleotide-binding domain-containing protein n=1 Tax=Paramecium tetraurelia TaxID=5888 RepID=A0CTU0_PARTE|nr:uncharacterized protein GSPATT00010441001 [Paramecium tetraurelia]CAK74207.1 unnamed protein product [Paramecium tetraurelia]|eukprot:XP_001441604.1 hypothetical protein (macronuclear) [Paramecium tetraurelia strain d4-2]
MTEIINTLVYDLLKLNQRNQIQAELIYDNLKVHLQPLFLKLQLQSRSEYILVSILYNPIQLCQRLHLLDLPPFQVISETQNENIYLFLEGKLVLDSSEQDDLDSFESNVQYVKKNKLLFQRQLNYGYIAEKRYLQKIFSLEHSKLLYVTKQSQSLLFLKHEQFIRQKRTFFLKLFEPTNQTEKQQIHTLADSLLLQQFEENETIITIYQPTESMFLVYLGQVNLETKRNIMCTCSIFDSFNEDCTMAPYTARVKQQAHIFEIQKSQLMQLPAKAQSIIEDRLKMKMSLKKSLLDHHIIDLQVPEIMKSVKYDKLTPKRKKQQSLTSITTTRTSFKKLHTETFLLNNTNLTSQNSIIKQDADVLLLPLKYHRHMTSRIKLNKFLN